MVLGGCRSFLLLVTTFVRANVTKIALLLLTTYFDYPGRWLFIAAEVR